MTEQILSVPLRGVKDLPLLTPSTWVNQALQGSTKVVLEYRDYAYGFFTYKQRVRRFLVAPSTFRKMNQHTIYFEAVEEGKKIKTSFEAHITEKVSTVSSKDIDDKKHPVNRDIFFETKVPKGKPRYRLQFETFLGQQYGTIIRFIDLETIQIYGEPPHMINGFSKHNNNVIDNYKTSFVVYTNGRQWMTKFN